VSLLAFDPGTTKGNAWARFHNGVLIRVGREEFPPLVIEEPSWSIVELVVIEKPAWHKKAGKSPAIVDDLIDLAIEVGKLQERYENDDIGVELVRASRWKGQVPKEIMSQRIYEALTRREVERLPLKARSKTSTSARSHDDNILDAVGLGLWKLGRMT
jgi:hypothetical protein